MHLTSRLANIELECVEGDEAAIQAAPVLTRLGSLWSDRPVVLVFIRHFG